MEKADHVYIGHILDTARKALARVQGLTRTDFDADEDLRLALAHLVQVIGEAARGVSQETRLKMPEVPWQEIVGMRHKIVHDYMNVDEDLVWEVVQGDLAPLVAHLAPLLPPDVL